MGAHEFLLFSSFQKVNICLLILSTVKSSESQKMPNSTMRIGIIGAGGMGATHARHYRRVPDVEVFFFDSDESKRSTFASAHQASPTNSVEDLIAQVDAVDICLPTDLHVPIGLLAFEAKKPVFMEKPMAGTLEDGVKLIEAAEAAGATLMVGHVVRYFPEFRRAHDLVVSGKIGTPAAARTRRGGLAPKSPWFSDYGRSGGALLDLAIHDFDWLRWTLGEVKCIYAKSLGISTGAWPDYALATLTFDGGAVAHVEATWKDPGGGRVTFEVCGSEGMIEHDSRRTAALRTTIAPESGGMGSPAMEAPLHPDDDPYLNQLKAFVEAARSNAEAPVTGKDGYMAMSIALAALESAKTGKVIAPSRI
jgi:predicted dehydrogenase